MENIKSIRKSLLKDMHNYVFQLGDESYYEWWTQYGVPDEPTEEDYDFIAEENDLWDDAVDIFSKIVKEIKK